MLSPNVLLLLNITNLFLYLRHVMLTIVNTNLTSEIIYILALLRYIVTIHIMNNILYHNNIIFRLCIKINVI